MSTAYRPTSLAEALRILADRSLGAQPIAGCTDLLAAAHSSRRLPSVVVDLLGLKELQGIGLQDGWVDLGAASTFTAIRQHPLICAHAPLLAEAAATVGAWQIQNRATLGGNIANASPAGDSLPVLLALGAELVLAGAAGERRLAFDAMHTGYRQTALLPGELIVRVRLPAASPEAIGRFRKVGTRAAQAISKVAVAFAARRAGGTLHDVRFAAGSVAATPVRLRAAEVACEGAAPTSALAEAAAEAARAAIEPIDDVRSTAAYRRFVLGQLVRRMVSDAAMPQG
jgi:xanthine dehydrogenase FAD-binding subunit